MNNSVMNKTVLIRGMDLKKTGRNASRCITFVVITGYKVEIYWTYDHPYYIILYAQCS